MLSTDKRWPVGGEDVAYGHSTGRLRLLEDRLLTTTELTGVVNQADQQSWKQLLDQLEYPEHSDLFARIAQAREEADKMLVELAADPVLSYSLLLYQNYHNLKVFLKGLLPVAGKAEALAMQVSGEIPDRLHSLLFWKSQEKIEDLWSLVVRTVTQGEQGFEVQSWKEWSEEFVGYDSLKKNSFVKLGLPPVYAQAVAQARSSYVQYGDAGQIDAVLDFYYFAHLAALAQVSGLPFLQTYARLKADLANLNVLYRSSRMRLAAELIAKLWVPGGQVEAAEQLVSLVQQPLVAWMEAFANTPVQEVVPCAFELAHPQAEETVESGRFARLSDNLLMQLARTGLAVIYGPQVVAGYWLARQTEAQNLRIILSMQAQGKNSQELLNLLREVYIHA